MISQTHTPCLILTTKNVKSHTSSHTSKKANKMMGLFRRSYTHLDKTSLRSLISSLVRPHLEYCVSIWYPLKKDEELIENILHQAAKIISGFYDKPYSCQALGSY